VPPFPLAPMPVNVLNTGVEFRRYMLRSDRKHAINLKLEVHGRARREAARRRKSECKINLSPR